jgi:hypothetical protein
MTELNDMYDALEAVEQEPETCGVVFDVEEYLTEHDKPSFNPAMPKEDFDLGGVRYLADAVGGFMLHPVALLKSEPLQAKTRKVLDIVEFKTHHCNKNVFIYNVDFIGSVPVYFKMDRVTFEPRVLDVPFIRVDNYWVIRYGELDN